MREELRDAVEKYSRSIIQSEAEVESKLIVPLTELLGYPSEFRAEQFPVYGFQGRTKLPAKSADFLLFDDKSFASHRTYSKKNIDWVQDHSLLVIEAKKPGEMPEVMGQAQYYSHWAKTIAYIVTDGVEIKGYYRNPISADETVLECKVSELPECEAFDRFSYDRIKAIKDIDFSKEIEKRVETQCVDENTVRHEDISLPAELVNYMRIVLGDESDSLNSTEVAQAYLSLMPLSPEGKYIPRHPIESSGVFVGNEEGLLFIDGKVVPFTSGTISYYDLPGLNRIVFENDYLLFDFLCMNHRVVSIKTGFHVQNCYVSTRVHHLMRAKEANNSDKITIKNKTGEVIVDLDIKVFTKESAYCIAQEGILDYWLKRMDQLKTIEEYYGIEFFLRPGLNAEETDELYNTVDIVYNGIAKRRNIFFEDEAEDFFEKNAPKEDTTIDCKEMKKMEWMDLEIHNYRFIPDRISFIHKDGKKLDISVEFAPVEIEENG